MPDEPASAPETEQTSTPAAAPTTVEPSATTPASAPSTSAEPSSPSPGDKPLDVHAELMKVATAAVTKTATERPSAPSDQGNGKAAPAPSGPGNGTAAPTAQVTQAKKPGGESKDGAAADEPPPFNDHPRWKKLTADYQTASKQVEELRAPAEQYGKITAYMDQFGITADDMVVAYDLIARMKTDPLSALERLEPIYRELQKRAGHTLPDDLAEKVDQGFMDEQSARELAQARVRARLSDEAASRASKTTEATVASTAVERNRGAAATWESSIIARDPDFERKRPMVQDAARAILAQEGQPRTPEAAVSVLDRAYKRVNDVLAGYAPRPAATPRQPSSASSPSPNNVAPPPPKNLREAAQQGLEGRYRFNQ